jgi:hypothetical protein
MALNNSTLGLSPSECRRIQEMGLAGDFLGMIEKINPSDEHSLNTLSSREPTRRIRVLGAFGDEALAEARLDQASAMFMEQYKLLCAAPGWAPACRLSTLCKAVIARCLAFPEEDRTPESSMSQQLTQEFLKALSSGETIPSPVIEQFVIAAGEVGAGSKALELLRDYLRNTARSKADSEVSRPLLQVAKAGLFELAARQGERNMILGAVAAYSQAFINQLNTGSLHYPQLRVYIQLRFARLCSSGRAGMHPRTSAELAASYFSAMQQEDLKQDSTQNNSHDGSQEAAFLELASSAPSPIFSALVLTELSRAAADCPELQEIFLNVYDSLQSYDVASRTAPKLASAHYLVGALQRWGYSSLTAAIRFDSLNEFEKKLSAAEKHVVRAKRFIEPVGGIEDEDHAGLKNVEHVNRAVLDLTYARIKLRQGKARQAIKHLRPALLCATQDGRAAAAIIDDISPLAWQAPRELSKSALRDMWRDVLVADVQSVVSNKECIGELKILAMIGLVRSLPDSKAGPERQLQIVNEGIQALRECHAWSGAAAMLNPMVLGEIFSAGESLLSQDNGSSAGTELATHLAALYQYVPELPDAFDGQVVWELDARVAVERIAHSLLTRGVLSECEARITERLQILERERKKRFGSPE